MRALLAIPILLAASLHGKAATPNVPVPRELSSVERFEIRLLFEDELFRQGGPRQERVMEIFRQALEAGNIHVVVEVESHVFQLVYRRLIDPNPFVEFFPAIAKLPRAGTSYENAEDMTRGLREEIVLWNLSPREREALYRGLIEKRANEYGLLGGRLGGMHWLTAAYRALCEHMDELLPVIERAVESNQESDPPGLSLIQSLRSTYLPLSKARLGGNWTTGYVALIRTVSTEGEVGRNDERDRLVREALSELVRKNRKDVVADLTEVWQVRKERGRSAEPQLSPDQPTVSGTPPGALLVRAIRAMGSKSFEESLWREWNPISPVEAERQLVREGSFKASERDR